MTEVNVPLLRKAVEWVEEQDKLPRPTRQWLQDEVVVDEATRVRNSAHERGCGSAYCLAGYVAMLTDDRFTNTQFVGGHSAIDVAEKALGLPPFHGLFFAENSAEDIREKAERIAGEKL